MWPSPYTISLMLLVLTAILLLDLLKGHGLVHDFFDDLLPRAFSLREYKSKEKSVMQEHGFVCAVLLFVFGFARWFMPTFLLVRPLPKYFNPLKQVVWDGGENKSAPWWHDVAYLASLGVLWFIPMAMFRDAWEANRTLLASWVLLDIFIYHANMFWFDELRPWGAIKSYGKVASELDEHEKKKPGPVWSFRRVFFQAIISYVASIHVFAYLYKPEGDWKTSLVAATLNADNLDFKLTDLPTGSLQMLFSLILLAIIISSTAAAVFSREQLAAR